MRQNETKMYAQKRTVIWSYLVKFNPLVGEFVCYCRLTAHCHQQMRTDLEVLMEDINCKCWISSEVLTAGCLR